MIQVTVARIKGYGPWTLTLGSDREHRLQMLQASLYGRLQGLFAERDCLVFPNRYDEYIIASNGLDQSDHINIRDKLLDEFEVGLQMHAGVALTPYDANAMAQKSREDDVFISGEPDDNNDIAIMHLDVDDLTSQTHTVSPYDISLKILDLYGMMAHFFRKRKSLSFFMGGDNFMVLSSSQGIKDVRDLIHETHEHLGITLNCGIGRATRSRHAAALATKSLDAIREMRDSGGEWPQVYESC